jgi:hypothetical protein
MCAIYSKYKDKGIKAVRIGMIVMQIRTLADLFFIENVLKRNDPAQEV